MSDKRALILSRRVGEALHIGDNVTLTVIEIIGNQARFKIEAPAHVAVDREEIRVCKDNNLPAFFINSKTVMELTDLVFSGECTQAEVVFLNSLCDKKTGTKLTPKQRAWLHAIQRRVEHQNAKRKLTA